MDNDTPFTDTLQFQNQRIEIIYRKSSPVDDPHYGYPGFKPGTTTLAEGSVHRKGALSLLYEIVFDRDIAVPMQDGTVIYIDVFRPTGAEKVLAIMG